MDLRKGVPRELRGKWTPHPENRGYPAPTGDGTEPYSYGIETYGLPMVYGSVGVRPLIVLQIYGLPVCLWSLNFWVLRKGVPRELRGKWTPHPENRGYPAPTGDGTEPLFYRIETYGLLIGYVSLYIILL